MVPERASAFSIMSGQNSECSQSRRNAMPLAEEQRHSTQYLRQAFIPSSALTDANKRMLSQLNHR